MKNITFDELYEYIKEHCVGDYKLLSYLRGFINNMLENSLYSATFSWTEGEIFEIGINISDDRLITYDIQNK